MATLALLFLTVIWGLTFPLIRISVQSMPPTFFVAIRFTLAALILVVFLGWKKRFREDLKKLLWIGLPLGMLVSLNYTLQTIGLETVEAGRAAFITGTLVVWVPLFSPFFGAGRPTLVDWLAAFGVAVGLYCLTDPLKAGGVNGLSRGDVLILICAFAAAIYIHCLQKAAKKHTQAGALSLAQILGVSAVSWVWFLAEKKPNTPGTAALLSNMPTGAVVGVLFCSIFATVIAFFLQTKYQARIRAEKAALIYSLEPVFGCLFGYLLLGEAFTRRGWLGAGIIFLSIICSELSKMKILPKLALLLLLLGPVTIVSAFAADSSLRFRVNEDLGSLDWGQGEVKQIVVQQLMEGLTVADSTGKTVEGAAERWTQSGNVYHFYLRNGATWSDGKKLCASDFVDAWDRIKKKQIVSSYSHYFDMIQSYSAESCSVLRIETSRAIIFLPALLSHWVFFPVRKDLIAKHGERAWYEPKNLVVNGPYLLTEWKRDQFLVFKRNPRYHWQKERAPKVVRAIVVPDDNTALTLFDQGKIDFMRDLPVMDRERLRKKPEYREFEAWIGYHLGFRSDVPKELRCRVANALDTREIPKVLNGGALPAGRSFVPNQLAPSARFSVSAPVAGSKNAHPLELQYYSKQVHIPLMEWVQARLKLAGIDARINMVEEKTYWSRLSSTPPEAFLSGTTAAYPHPYAFLSEMLPKSGGNWGHYDSKEYVDAAEAASIEKDPVKLGKLVLQAEEQLVGKDCAVIPLYFRKTTALVGKGWPNTAVNPMGYTYFKDSGGSPGKNR